MRDSVGLNARHISTLAATASETKNYDMAILISCGFGLVGLAVAADALAVNFDIEQQIIELLAAVMP